MKSRLSEPFENILNILKLDEFLNLKGASMYWQDKWVFKDSNEYEIKFFGRYGSKNEKRGKRKKPTPEIIKQQNQKNREKYMRRLLKANFEKGDLWITLKYVKGTRKPLEEVKKELRRFLDTMRRRYKSHGVEFKFIYRLEIGSKGGIHIHMVVPRIRGADTDEILQDAWSHGRINHVNLDGTYQNLANYIVKQPTEEVSKQLAAYPQEERKAFIKYSTSRNLNRPIPERKEFKRRTVRRIVLDRATYLKASKGYDIDWDSVNIGVNPYTGMSYIHYTERKVRGG